MARISELLAGGPTFSFEFFPPKNEAGWLSLGRTIAELEPLKPSFVSVTYGAGGSTRSRTHDLVSWISRQTPIPPMAHLTCSGHRRSEIDDILRNYQGEQVDNILALGGDPPADGSTPPEGDYRYAADLVEHVAEYGSFSIGVAAHPELHPRSADRRSDRGHLAAKLRAADFAVTQFFFEVDTYRRMVDELADLGVTNPVIPGIMPVTDLAQVSRMAQMSGAEVPAWLIERVTAAGTPEIAQRTGVEIAAELCAALLDLGAPGLHFYTLNRAGTTRDIWRALGSTVAH